MLLLPFLATASLRHYSTIPRLHSQRLPSPVSLLYLALMDAFYTPPENITSCTLTLVREEAHHLARVMRKKIGERIFVADGEGTMLEAQITDIGSEEVHCRILTRLPDFNEPSRKVVLVQSLLKNPAKMDWIVEKATELGVAAIIPMISHYSQTTKIKIDRLQHLALAAMKQSLRCTVPRIETAATFEQACESTNKVARIPLHERADAENSIENFLVTIPESEDLALFIGPEGGFSDEEIQFAEMQNIFIASLGTRRLRSETAAVAALARLRL